MFNTGKRVEVIDGYRFVYHSNGKVNIKEQIFNGVKNGTFEQFYSSGQKHVTGTLNNGKKHGVFEIFSESGKLLNRCTFSNDTVNGEYLRYFEDGRVLAHTYFHYGVDLKVDPNTLTEKDKTYIALCGRLPIHENSDK